MALQSDCFDVDEVGDVTAIRFTDPTPLDDVGSQGLALLLFELAGQEGHRLHLDLGNVSYVSSAGLGEFVGLHRRLRALGGHLVLRNVSPAVYEVFEITRLHTLLDIRPV